MKRIRMKNASQILSSISARPLSSSFFSLLTQFKSNQIKSIIRRCVTFKASKVSTCLFFFSYLEGEYSSKIPIKKTLLCTPVEGKGSADMNEILLDCASVVCNLLLVCVWRTHTRLGVNSPAPYSP